MKMIKVMAVLALTVAVLAFVAAPAMAEHGGGYWPADDWATYGVPHGGYTDTSGKCKVCHAVHGAGLNELGDPVAPPTEKLLRTTAADACIFCHITGAYATTVYGGNVYIYKNMTENNDPYTRVSSTGATSIRYGMGQAYSGHGDDHRSGYSGCVSCHSVHGAYTIAGSPILKNDPANGVSSAAPTTAMGGTVAGYGSFVEPVTTQRDFCLDCHDGTRRVESAASIITIDNDEEFNTVFSGCSCHNSIAEGDQTLAGALNDDETQFGVSAPSTKNGRSHVMSTAFATGAGQLAWSATAVAAEGVDALNNSCTTCHDASEDFPHYSATQNLIDSIGYGSGERVYDPASAYVPPESIVQNSGAQNTDAVCAKCHTDSGFFGPTGTDYTAGVGKTY